MDFYISIIALILLHSFIDSYLIKRQIRIDHIKGSFVFCVVWALLTILFKIEIKQSIFFVVISRIGLFDFSLNLFRGKSIFYISPSVDGKYTGKYESKWDEIIGKNANLIRILGFFSTIIFLIKNY